MPELELPAADQVRMREIEWYIITADNYEKIFEEIEATGESPVLIGLTSEGYERISLNLSDIRAYLQQQQAIIKAYKEYYAETEEAIKKANEQIKKANEDKGLW